MKKIALLLVFILTLSFCLYSCGYDGGDSEDQDGGQTDDTGDKNDDAPASLSYKDDMTKYVSLGEQEREFDVEIPFSAPGEFELNEKIIKLLYSNRGKAQNEGLNLKGQTVKAGDSVNIYYRGYLVENGEKAYFDGGCNFTSSEMELGIGSGQFISGFESGLVGKNASDYVSLSVVSDGEVQAGDTVVFTYSAKLNDGTEKKNVTAYIPLSEGDGGFGSEFCNILIGMKADDKLTEEKQIVREVDGKTITDTYTGIEIKKILRPQLTDSEGGALPTLTVDAYFPTEYGMADLAGKWAKFDVYIMTVRVYDAPEYNDSFVTDVLKIDRLALSKYEGDTPCEQHRNMLLQELEDEHRAKVNEYVEEQMWQIYLERVTVKELPEDVLRATYNSALEELQSYYNYYSGYFGSFEECAAYLLNLSEGQTWEDALNEVARNTVIRDALLFYLMKDAGVMPSDSELDKLAKDAEDELFDDYLAYFGVKRENYESDALYNAAAEKYRESFNSMYPDDYFVKQEIYALTYKLTEKFANVSYAE